MKFLNLELDKKLSKKLLVKHLLFFFFWAIGIAIFLLRLDSIFYRLIKLNILELNFVAPVIYLFLLFFLIKNQRWYFTIAFFFYPLLLIFWFVPKWLLFNGKIYIFLYYLNFIVGIIHNYKKVLFITSLGLILLILLIVGHSQFVKVFSILFFSYIYILFVKNFLKQIFRPTNFLEPDSKTKIEKSLTRDDSNSIPFIKNLEVQKVDDKLTPEEREKRIKQRLINTKFIYEYLSQSLSGFRNERSYILFCIFQLLLYFTLTVCYFSFINFQIFSINKNLFSVSSIPSVFDFLYYTLKTITFSTIDFLKPNSPLTKLVEIFSFLMLGIFLLIIVVSLLFSLQRYKLKDMMETSARTLEAQNKILANHIEEKYGQSAKNDQDGFAEWIKKLLNRIF